MVNLNHGKPSKWRVRDFSSVFNICVMYSITHLIELAEEKTGCSALVVSIDRHNYKDTLSTMLRAFMYLGFEMINPAIYGQEAGYVLVGYEL